MLENGARVSDGFNPCKCLCAWLPRGPLSRWANLAPRMQGLEFPGTLRGTNDVMLRAVWEGWLDGTSCFPAILDSIARCCLSLSQFLTYWLSSACGETTGPSVPLDAHRFHPGVDPSSLPQAHSQDTDPSNMSPRSQFSPSFVAHPHNLAFRRNSSSSPSPISRASGPKVDHLQGTRSSKGTIGLISLKFYY